MSQLRLTPAPLPGKGCICWVRREGGGGEESVEGENEMSEEKITLGRGRKRVGLLYHSA